MFGVLEHIEPTNLHGGVAKILRLDMINIILWGDIEIWKQIRFFPYKFLIKTAMFLNWQGRPSILGVLDM